MINKTAIRKYVNDRGKRISRDTFTEIERRVQTMLDKALATHNGGKITIDIETFNFANHTEKR